MALQMLAKRDSLAFSGTIKLSETDEKGTPIKGDFFVLDQAPDAIRIYGDKPTELHGYLPYDNLDLVAGTWFKWYGGGRKVMKDGKMTREGGQLYCIGNGPDSDGNPGTATYRKDGKGPDDKFPTRACLGKKCPDAFSAQGQAQCKQTMRLVLYMPHVNPLGFYKIDTSSWTSIFQIYDQLRIAQQLFQGRIAGIPFKIYREKHEFKVPDPRNPGKQTTATHHIMKVVPYPEYNVRWGDAAAQALAMFSGPRQQQLSAADHAALIEAPMPDHFGVEGEHETIDVPPRAAMPPTMEDAPVQQKVGTAESLLADPEVVQAFQELEAATGTKLSFKQRLIGVRMREKEADMKGAVLAGLRAKTEEARKKAAPEVVQGEVIAPPPAQPVSPPAVDGGIM